MKKQLAAALVAAFAAAGAQAQTNVQVYGVVDAFAGRIENSNGGANLGTGSVKGSATVVDSGGLQTSFFGIRGTEDLGGGLKGVFALEAFFRPDTGAYGRFGAPREQGFTRNANVGLSGSFGTVTVGRNTAPFFLSTILFNPFIDSFTVGPVISHNFRGDNNTQGIVDGDTGISNSIRYVSPTVGGLRADIAFAAASDSAVSNATESFVNKNGRLVDAALFFGRGPLGLTAAYRTLNNEGSALLSGLQRDKQNTWQLGASYDLKLAKAFAQYGRSKTEFLGGDTEKTTWQLGASVPVAAGNVLVSFANSRLDGNSALAIADSRRETWAVGYDYNLSKRSDVYAVYYRDNMKTVNVQTVLALGIRHRF